MNNQKHYFFALELPSQAKQALEQWSTILKREEIFKNWVYREDYHITLAFLGHAQEEMAKQAAKLIEKRLIKQSSVISQINGIKTFGKPKSPRILWAGLEENPIVKDIQKIVANSCIETGFKLDTKPFVPHITIARRALKTLEMDQLAKWNRALPEINSFLIENIVLYRTNIGNIPKYEPLVRLKLQ